MKIKKKFFLISCVVASIQIFLGCIVFISYHRLFTHESISPERSGKYVTSLSHNADFVDYIILTSVILSVPSVLYLLRKMYKSITIPLKDLDRLASAFGDGDFTIRIDDSRKDEFGLLSSHFNQTAERLNGFLREIRDGIEILCENTEELTRRAEKIAVNTKEQSNQTTHAATAMEELSTSFIDVAKNAAEAAQSASKATELAINGGNIVEQTIEGMTKISRSVSDSSNIIEELGKSSAQIGEIVKVINEIAEQTNLLALNAAIEAARAGEQGRGFAVVADEVRKLAEKTTHSTKEIGEMIKHIQTNAQKAVDSMESGKKDVENGVALAYQAGEALKDIVRSVKNVTDMIHQIAAAAEEQSATGGEVAMNIESVANITKNNANYAEESYAYSHEIRNMAMKLHTLAKSFKLGNGVTQDVTITPRPKSSAQPESG